ncbi:MAG: hypothetical protein AAF666_00230 [Pseudomonadota bacterium]
MLTDEDALMAQLSAAGPVADDVRSAYLALAHARFATGMTVRPASHGYIERELRFELSGAALYAAVLNQKWILWYFRKPAFAGGAIDMHATAARFSSSEMTKYGEVKVRVFNRDDAHSVLQWIGGTAPV